MAISAAKLASLPTASQSNATFMTNNPQYGYNGVPNPTTAPISSAQATAINRQSGQTGFTVNGQNITYTPTSGNGGYGSATQTSYSPSGVTYTPGTNYQLPTATTTPVVPTSALGTQPLNLQGYTPNTPAVNSLVNQVQTAGTQATVDQNLTAVQQAKLAQDKLMNTYNTFATSMNLPGQYDQLRTQAGIPDMISKLNQANLDLAGMKSNYAQKYQLAENKAIPTPFIVGEQTQIQKMEAIDVGAQAAYVQALQGNIDLANQYVDKTVNLMQTDYNNKLDVLKTNLNLATNNLSAAQQRETAQLNQAFDIKKIEYQNFLSAKTDIAKSLITQGLNPASVLKANNWSEMATSSLQTQGANGQDLNAYSNVIDTIGTLVPNTQRAVYRNALTGALAKGDFATAYSTVANAVDNQLTGTAKTKFEDTRTDIQVMAGMRNAIQQYAAAGGDMGYLKGTADDLAKKFGQLAVDPKFAALGVQLQREFQSYRLAMTGAAFSPAESAEYAAVNPRAGASLDLNIATIDGALAQLTNRYVGTINARIPGADTIYQKLIGTTQPAQTTNQQLSVDDAYNKYLEVTGQKTTTTTQQTNTKPTQPQSGFSNWATQITPSINYNSLLK